MSSGSYKESFKISMRSQGRDLISFYSGLARELQRQVKSDIKIDLQEDYCLVLLEAYRRNCVNEILKIFAFLVNRDQQNFTQILKKYNNTRFLSSIFRQDQDFRELKNQSDPLYYLEIMNKILSFVSPISMNQDQQKLFQKIDYSYQIMLSHIPKFLDNLIESNRDKNPLKKYEQLNQDIKQQVRLCFLATYANELCTKLPNQNHPYFIFKDKTVNYDENEDNFLLKTLQTHSFFIVTNEKSDKKLSYSQMPLVVDFTEDEVSEITFYKDNQFSNQNIILNIIGIYLYFYFDQIKDIILFLTKPYQRKDL